MKKRYRSFIKGTNWALGGALALLGFSNCGDVYEEVMYGVPWKSFAVQGTVVDKETGEPVPDIEVSIALPGHEQWKDTTDSKGVFKLEDTPSLRIPVAFHDVDGEKNGSYLPDTIQVSEEGARHIESGGRWFKGEFLQTVKAELKKKNANE
jgi:putative lipoprotein (rSAM/lipoprotein system)